MRLALGFSFSLLASAALAQTNPNPITRAAPFIVTEAQDPNNHMCGGCGAAGITHLSVDEFAPVSSQTFANLSSQVANLHIDSGGAGSFGDLVTLRGLSNTPYFSDPSVTLTFDDIPLGSSFTYPTSLFGFASATIARGPQGTALGRGGEGGAIVLTSAEPGAQPGGQLRLSAGNFNTHSVAVTASSARGETADATIAASLFERDGFITNKQLGTRVDDRVKYAASARVRFRPAKTSEFSLQLLASRHNDGAQPLVPLGGPHFSVARGREGSTDIDFGGFALKGAFDTALGRLTSTTSGTDWKLKPYDNRLVLPPTIDSALTQHQRVWNEELRLASDAHAAIPWHAGAWFSDGRTTGGTNRGLFIGAPTDIPIEVSGFTLDARTVALFGEMTFAPAPGWHVTAGARAEEVKKDFDRSQRVPGAGHFVAHETFESFQPKLAASYALTASTNFFASIAAGTKPGGWSAYTGNATLAPFAAEKALAYEAGLDSTLANKTVTLAARVFYYDLDHYQIERSFNAQDYLVVTAPRARSLGGELESAWHATRELTLTATLGVTDVTLREFTDPFTHKSYAGNRAPYAPTYNAHASATWRPATGWFAVAEVARTGKTFFDESENPIFASKAHTVTNARVGYEAPRWRVSVYGENLFDEAYYTLVIPGVRHAAPGAPRTWGVECAAKW